MSNIFLQKLLYNLFLEDELIFTHLLFKNSPLLDWGHSQISPEQVFGLNANLQTFDVQSQVYKLQLEIFSVVDCWKIIERLRWTKTTRVGTKRLEWRCTVK